MAARCRQVDFHRGWTYIQPSPWRRKSHSLETYAWLFQRGLICPLHSDPMISVPWPLFSLTGVSGSCTSLLKYLGFQGLLSAALCFSSPRCRSSRRCLCSVASSMFPSFRDLVTCFHSLLEPHKKKTKKTLNSSTPHSALPTPSDGSRGSTWTLSSPVSPQAAASSWWREVCPCRWLWFLRCCKWTPECRSTRPELCTRWCWWSCVWPPLSLCSERTLLGAETAESEFNPKKWPAGATTKHLSPVYFTHDLNLAS